MRQLRLRRYTSYSHLSLSPSSPPHSPPRSQILHLCDSGSISQALLLLTSSGPRRLPPKPILYAALLQASAAASSFAHGLQLHSCILKSGLDNDRFVGNSLLSFYFKVSPDFSLTRRVFESLPLKDVISWTSMVSGYVRAGRPTESLRMFAKMQAFGVEPNAFTLSAAIKACSDLRDVKLGSCLHGMVLLRGFGLDHVIGSALVDMYGKNSALEDAWRLFGEMLEPDAICWTSMISACTRNDRFEDAVGLFHSMMRRKLGLFPDEFTFGTIMTALGNLGRARQGRDLHDFNGGRRGRELGQGKREAAVGDWTRTAVSERRDVGGRRRRRAARQGTQDGEVHR